MPLLPDPDAPSCNCINVAMLGCVSLDHNKLRYVYCTDFINSTMYLNLWLQIATLIAIRNIYAMKIDDEYFVA